MSLWPPVKPPVHDQSSAQTQASRTPGRGIGAVTHSSPPHQPGAAAELSSARPGLCTSPAPTSCGESKMAGPRGDTYRSWGCFLGCAKGKLHLESVQTEKFLKYQCFVGVGLALCFKQDLSLA